MKHSERTAIRIMINAIRKLILAKNNIFLINEIISDLDQAENLLYKEADNDIKRT